ncbi:2-phosphosulfolactate phosphatase [Halobacillus litoralis]|uniref:Probable 2-phosphosulfolactate phosphatase n=1 Tax=Halobacillus litoralis TaxID=45668 RepID=A0A410MBE2_9BACI|nr:2-phosphosulfolactate phosphatase [Halobacillus litoralis]QAS51976.1 2-phosphosulfolactate phosphatase [Halobacillus litoralis]
MGDVQVIFKKEDIRPEDLQGKTVVVFDVLFATSTITAAIADGAASVIPVHNPEEARIIAKKSTDSFIMAGEDQGKRIEGFYPPLRTHLSSVIKDKHLILTTTNGTVALHQSRRASDLYASSLLNNPAMADHLLQFHKDDSIILICSGSNGRYTMEDFYGVGSLVSHMRGVEEWNLSDAAMTAHLFYKGNKDAAHLLQNSRIGKMLMSAGLDQKEIDFAAQEGLFNSILIYDSVKGQIKEGKHASN